MPSPSRRTRDGEAFTKPSLSVRAGFVEAALFLGGQLFVFSRTKLSYHAILFSRSDKNGGSGCVKLRAAAFGQDRQGGMRHGQRGHLPFERRSNERAAASHELRLQRIAWACGIRAAARS